MFSETNEIKKIFIHTSLTLKIVLNLVWSALFLPIKLSSKFKKQTLNLFLSTILLVKTVSIPKSIIKRVDNIKFNKNFTVHVILQNMIWRFSTIQNFFKHLNLKVTFQEWKQHLKIPNFVDYLWKVGLNIFH